MIFEPGEILLADLSPSVGHEQAGRRPCLVVSKVDHLALTAGRLITVASITSRDRGVINHILITPDSSHRLDRKSWVMTEQVRTISSRRVIRSLGRVVEGDLAEVRRAVGRLL